MNGHESLTPEEVQTRDAVRGLGRPGADPGFRARLRQEFVSGTIESSAPKRALVIPWHRTPMARWGGVALAAAALLVVVGFLNAAPDWRLNRVTGDGMVIVDGRPVPTAHASELERLMSAGAFVRVPTGVEIELMSRGVMAVQFTPGTEASVPNPPGRWFQRTSLAEIRRGEWRITTGRDFQGARLAIDTPEARVEVTGTTFAVICEPEGTCVCVMEGRLNVGTRGGSGPVEVREGNRRFVYADGRPEEMEPMLSREHAPLGDLKERMREPMEK